MSDEPRNPELETLLGLVIEQALESFYVMVPARVVSYNETNQSASVQPLIRRSHVDEFDIRRSEVLPEIHDVPVAHPGAAKGRITFPIEAGDLGRLVFASMSIARWKLLGGVVDPGDDRRHDYNDCVFEPGLHSLNAVPTTAPTDAMVLHAGDGKKLKLGGPTGTSAVVVQDALNDFMTALASAISTLGAPAAPELAALQAALQALNTATGWKARTSKTEAK